MLSLANEVASDPSNQYTINDFVTSLRELLSSIHDIQEELSRGIDVPEQDEDEVDIGGEEDLDPFTATPATTAHERMMRKNLERMRSQPRYIGGLGKRILPTPRTLEGEPQVGVCVCVWVCVCVCEDEKSASLHWRTRQTNTTHTQNSGG